MPPALSATKTRLWLLCNWLTENGAGQSGDVDLDGNNAHVHSFQGLFSGDDPYLLIHIYGHLSALDPS
jgi:hypothetical protein